MTESEAIQLIQGSIQQESKATSWVDLGSGSGTFTKALAQLLPDGSTILAIDKDNHRITSPNKQVVINFLHADFTKGSLPHSLDGILMANALHYVNDQSGFLTRISSHLKPTGQLLLIEYDTDLANTWVPYPITFSRLKE